MNFISYFVNTFRKITNIVFARIFVIFIIAISIPAVSIGLLLIEYSSDYIVRQASLYNNNILAERTRIIDQRIEEIDNSVMQCIFNNNIVSITNNEDIKENPIIMSEIIVLFAQIVNASDLIDSIYFYNDSHDFVLTNETKYTKTDFIDPGALLMDMEDNRHAVYRETVNSEGQNKGVISYTKKFSYFSDNKILYFIVNLNYDILFRNIAPVDSRYSLGMLILDEKNNIVFFDGKTLNTLDQSALGKISQIDEDNTVISIYSTDYFISKTHSDILRWTIAYIQPYQSLVRTASLLKRLILPLTAVVLLISFGLAYVFSTFLYKPLAKLVLEVKKYSDDGISEDDNEYVIINKALRNLLDRYNELDSKYQHTFPYFQQNFVYGIVYDGFLDIGIFEEALKQMGITFGYSRYFAILIDFENTIFSDEMKESLDLFFAKVKGDFESIVSSINETRLVIIVNTDKEAEETYHMLRELKDEFNGNNVDLTISVGKPYFSLNDVCMSFKEVLKQMENKFFIGKNEIIYNSNSCSIEEKFIYDKNRELELVNHIKSLNYESAIRTLEEITDYFVQKASSIEYIKYIHFKITTNILYSLVDIGVKFSEDEISEADIFTNIQKSETYQELQEFVSSLVSKCISHVEDLKKMRYSSLVAKTIDYMENNYHRDISLDDISRNVFLSSRHISSIFKEETGFTIINYLKKLRMEKAKKLITRENIKIQEVATKLGYNNIQTFLRLFKKFYGITPVQYRRKS